MGLPLCSSDLSDCQTAGVDAVVMTVTVSPDEMIVRSLLPTDEKLFVSVDRIEKVSVEIVMGDKRQIVSVSLHPASCAALK